MNFAERLKELRLNKGWSQRQLGEKLGISNVAISMYERGERTPDYETLELICDIFNVSIDYILGKEDVSAYLLKPSETDFLIKLKEDEDLYALVEKLLNGTSEQRERFLQMAELMGVK